MNELFQYTFFQNALLGSLFASIACGIIGTYIVTRRLVFISGGITHASFGGVGIGLYTGLSPLLTAAIFSILSAFGVEWLSKRSDMREDSAIAVFWTFGMAVGIIFSFLAPGFTPDLSSFLFGNILTITQSDIWLLAILSVVLAVFFALFLRPIVAIAFDREFARSQRIPVAACCPFVVCHQQFSGLTQSRLIRTVLKRISVSLFLIIVHFKILRLLKIFD
jgi:zinc transport system permease protein